MNEFEIIRHIMMLDEVSHEEISKKSGYKHKAGVSNRLNGKNIYVKTWRKILNSLGYEIVVRPIGSKNGGYVVDDSELPSPQRFTGMNLRLDTIVSPEDISDEELVRLLEERNKKNPHLLDNIKHKREVKKQLETMSMEDALMKLWNERQSLSQTEYENELGRICNNNLSRYNSETSKYHRWLRTRARAGTMK